MDELPPRDLRPRTYSQEQLRLIMQAQSRAMNTLSIAIIAAASIGFVVGFVIYPLIF
jgi:hypothetical protein